MRKILVVLLGLLAYAVFLPTFLYLIAFVGNLQHSALAGWVPGLSEWVPVSIDHGRAAIPVPLAAAIDVLLIALFGLQHSIMARPAFKQRLERFVPGTAERSVFVLAASLALIVLFWQWRPIPIVLWSAESAFGQALGWSVFAAGFGMVLVATFLIDHFELFGLRQIWSEATDRELPRPRFVTPLFYRRVRHPLYLGFLLAFWGGPTMTLGHALFAAGMTGYILLAVRYEERDLLRMLGRRYAEYRKRVPMLIPRPGRSARDLR